MLISGVRKTFVRGGNLRMFAKITTPEEAVKVIKKGDVVLSGGFGICGNPNTMIKQLVVNKIGNLTVASNNAGLEDYGVGLLLHEGLVKRMISSYVGGNDDFKRRYLEGLLEVEFTPQGTLAEKIRSGGKGIPAFWTPTGANSAVETGGFPIKY